MSPTRLCPPQVAWHGAGMSFPPCPALPMSRTCKDLSLFFSISSPCSGLCQRKRLRYSDLDFEVSLAVAVGITGAHRGVGCHLGTEPPCPQFPLALPAAELGGVL